MKDDTDPIDLPKIPFPPGRGTSPASHSVYSKHCALNNMTTKQGL